MLKKPVIHLILVLAIVATVLSAWAREDRSPSAGSEEAEVSATRVGELELDLPDGVKVLQSRGHTALLHLNTQGKQRVVIDLEFSGPSTEWSFNLGDSNTNNGWGGDSSTARNDAEIQILNGHLEVYGSDLLDHYPQFPAKQRFMHRWERVVDDDGGRVHIEIADGEVTYISEEGKKDTFLHPALFALAGQADPEAGVNYDLYLGVNRVVVGGREGQGLSGVKIRYVKDH